MRLIDADALIKKRCKQPMKGDCKNCDWYGDSWCRCEIFGVQIAEFPTIEAEPVKRGRWVKHSRKAEDCDGFLHHMCSHCKTEAPFHYIYVDDYDEGMDGEWYLLGQREDGIEEVLSKRCPNCGAKMDKEG